MSEEEQTLLMIRGAISILPAESRETITEMAEHIRRMIRTAPPGEGSLAVALVGAELAAEGT